VRRIGDVAVSETLDFVVRHGYALLFLWILAEQAALPLPSAPLLLACGALARAGRLSPHLVILAGVAACLVGDSVWFATGRGRGAGVLRFICRVALEPDSCVRRTETLFTRFGSRSLLIAKFIPGLNAVAAPLAGISGVGTGRFLLFDTLGALIWMVSYTGLGYLFSGQLDRVGAYAERMGSWALALAVGSVAGWIAWRFWQRRRFLRGLAVARITAEQLARMLEAGEDVVVVDVRHAADGERDAVPGALRIPLEELEKRHPDIPRDREIVLVCS
jgi:membrane protein DedA with SNARE-associated domain